MTKCKCCNLFWSTISEFSCSFKKNTGTSFRIVMISGPKFEPIGSWHYSHYTTMFCPCLHTLIRKNLWNLIGFLAKIRNGHARIVTTGSRSQAFRVVVKWQMRQQTTSEVRHQSVRGLSIMESTLRGPQLFLFFQPIASELESGRFFRLHSIPVRLPHLPRCAPVGREPSVPISSILSLLLLLLSYISDHYFSYELSLLIIV